MPLVSLITSVDSASTLSTFSFAHARDHDDIDAALLALGIEQPSFPLDPISITDGGSTWLAWHQQKHDAMNLALKLTGNNLQGFDFRNPAQLNGFINLNYPEHEAVHSVLQMNT